MSDRLHNHLTLGYVEDCEACQQTRRDVAATSYAGWYCKECRGFRTDDREDPWYSYTCWICGARFTTSWVDDVPALTG